MVRFARPWVLGEVSEPLGIRGTGMAGFSLRKVDMRTALLALVVLFALGACASTSSTKYSVTPQTTVVVKAPKKKAAQANYRVSPEESKLTGSGGSEK